MQQYYATSKKDNILYLNKDDLNHIKNVMRMKENDLILAVFEDKSYKCYLNKDLLSARIDSIFKTQKEEQDFIVHVPLLSEDKLGFIFKHGTELGITKYIVVQYEHCKYKLPKKDYEKKLTRWNKIIKEASEQSYRVNKPTLDNIINIDEIECLDGVNILCSLDKINVKSVCKVLTKNNCQGTINLVFGPEGGLSIKEEELLENKGFIKTSLGEDVLRTETVPLMIASVVKYLKESEKHE